MINFELISQWFLNGNQFWISIWNNKIKRLKKRRMNQFGNNNIKLSTQNIWKIKIPHTEQMKRKKNQTFVNTCMFGVEKRFFFLSIYHAVRHNFFFFLFHLLDTCHKCKYLERMFEFHPLMNTFIDKKKWFSHHILDNNQSISVCILVKRSHTQKCFCFVHYCCFVFFFFKNI